MCILEIEQGIMNIEISLVADVYLKESRLVVNFMLNTNQISHVHYLSIVLYSSVYSVRCLLCLILIRTTKIRLYKSPSTYLYFDRTCLQMYLSLSTLKHFKAQLTYSLQVLSRFEPSKTCPC